jgi:hypothetical protein
MDQSIAAALRNPYHPEETTYRFKENLLEEHARNHEVIQKVKPTSPQTITKHTECPEPYKKHGPGQVTPVSSKGPYE